jgi:hypothetical protein
MIQIAFLKLFKDAQLVDRFSLYIQIITAKLMTLTAFNHLQIYAFSAWQDILL